MENDSLTTQDVEDIKLSRLKLQNKSLFCYDDITGYEIENHIVYLVQKPSSYSKTGYNALLFSKYFGNPFVIVANGERIYLGSFHPMDSSWLPNTPYVYYFGKMNEKYYFKINGAPFSDESFFVDIRNDKRIRQALNEKIIEE